MSEKKYISNGLSGMGIKQLETLINDMNQSQLKAYVFKLFLKVDEKEQKKLLFELDVSRRSKKSYPDKDAVKRRVGEIVANRMVKK